MRDNEITVLRADTLVGLQVMVNGFIAMGNYRVVSIVIDNYDYAKYVAVIAGV